MPGNVDEVYRYYQ